MLSNKLSFISKFDMHALLTVEYNFFLHLDSGGGIKEIKFLITFMRVGNELMNFTSS